jgi:hypothetical protein
MPAETPIAKPEPLMLATLLLDELQLTDEVMSWLLPSLNLPVAVNCCVAPMVIAGPTGVTISELRTEGGLEIEVQVHPLISKQAESKGRHNAQAILIPNASLDSLGS